MTTSNTITKTDLENIINAIFPATSEDMTQAQIDAFIASLNVNGGNGLIDISSSFTVNSTYVSAFRAYTDGKFVYVKFTSKGAPDQTNVITNIAEKYRPPSTTDSYYPLSCFFMNATDFTRDTNVAVISNRIQLRCSTASQGSGGIIIGGSYPIGGAVIN